MSQESTNIPQEITPNENYAENCVENCVENCEENYTENLKEMMVNVVDNSKLKNTEIGNLFKDILLLAADLGESMRIKETDTEEEKEQKERKYAYTSLTLSMLPFTCENQRKIDK